MRNRERVGLFRKREKEDVGKGERVRSSEKEDVGKRERAGEDAGTYISAIVTKLQ